MEKQLATKTLLELIRDLDYMKMSGSLFISNASQQLALYFHAGYLIYALKSDNEAPQPMELNQQQVLKLFCLLHKNSYHFDNVSEAPHQHHIKMRAADLILAVVRTIDNEQWLCERIGDLQQIFNPIADLLKRADGLLLLKPEIDILGQLDVAISIEELIHRLGRPSLETLRSLYALCLAGVIDPPQNTRVVSDYQHGFAILSAMNGGKKSSSPQPQPTKGLQLAQTPEKPHAVETQAQPANFIPTTIVNTTTINPPAVNKPPASSPSPMSKPKSKITTGDLEKLCGVKIRSMSGNSTAASTTASTSDSQSDKYYQHACQAMKAGDVVTAETFLRNALSFAPDHVPYLLALGRLLSKFSLKQKEAEGLLLLACSNDMNAIEPRMALAELYESMGMKIKAETVFNSVLKIDPNNQVAQRKLSALNVSQPKQSLWGKLTSWGS